MAIMFSVVSLLLLLGVGIAIDYSKMVSTRLKLQSITDAAVLAAATSGSSDQNELQKLVDRLAEDSGYPNVKLNVTITDANTILVDASDTHNMLILGAFDYDDRSIGASSEAPFSGMRRINMALVLDTTGSMRGERLAALKTAATNLVDVVGGENEAGNEHVKISLVPFADYVRISPDNRNKPWLERQPDQDVTFRSFDAENSVNCVFSVSDSGERDVRTCDELVTTEETRFVTWFGCMGSRTDGYHNVPRFDSRRLQGFLSFGRCSTAYNITEPLTTDFNKINATIESLFATGRTYMPSGLIWGWRTLDPKPPFERKIKKKDEDETNILLLMTDGANSVNLGVTIPDFNGIFHHGTNSEQDDKALADELTRELCGSIKRDGIQIITVAFAVDDASTRSLLESCASSRGDYYDASDAAQLQSAFGDIGRGINEVRLIR